MGIMVHESQADVLNVIYEGIRSSDDRDFSLGSLLCDCPVYREGDFFAFRFVDDCLKEQSLRVRASESLQYERSNGFCSMRVVRSGVLVPVQIGVNRYYSGFRSIQTECRSQTLREFMRSEASVSRA